MTRFIDPTSLALMGKFGLLIVPIFYALSAALSKEAILCFFLRVFLPGPARTITYITGVVVALHSLIYILFTLLECRPISLLWALRRDGCTIDINATFRWWSVPNVITDIVMFILPMPTVWTLKTSIQIKIGITITFVIASA